MKPNPPKPFDIKAWSKDHLPEAYHSQAVKLLNQCDLTPDQVNEIFQLGRSTQRFEDEAELKDHEATVSGLYDALKAKNETVITVNKEKLIPFLLLILIGVELYRTIYP